MVYQLKMYTPADPERVLYNYMYIAWLTMHNCKCMSSHLKSIRRMGQRDPSTFSIYVYASTSWAHLKINELIFLIYTGYIVKNV